MPDVPTVEVTMSLKTCKTQLSETTFHYQYFESGTVLSFREVVERWADSDQALLDTHNRSLSEIPFAAYKWETPCVDLDSFDRAFEFVVLNSPSLNRREDLSAFRNQFRSSADSGTMIQFQNLGKDAVLVVPRPCGAGVNHCHLASFLATCTANEKSDLWVAVGKAMLARVSAKTGKPVWLSTAGGGVPWLHVRLDDRPKYYGYRKSRESR